ncbi:YfjI family protein [Brucella sp. JSBI001]|jgi:Protein of unknown function (DUF3987)|uniref:YfjI family protein n=1 Tax=Brucella sp. JSBI001 TaxID=2886044 RepID=UPI002230C899|nr:MULTISPECIES: YfjI family protein [Brucella]UZD69305.1 YfjI family protein [Brucella sp. JSBI001]
MNIQQNHSEKLGDFLANRSLSIKSDLEIYCAVDEAVSFLKKLDPTGRHNIVRIKIDRVANAKHAPRGRTFEPSQWDAIRAYLADGYGRDNYYFSLNEPRPNSPNGKLSKADILGVRALCVDIDPDDGIQLEPSRERIRQQFINAADGDFPPTAVWDSGGGFQACWIIDEKVPVTPEIASEIESFGRSLACQYDGDRVQNIDRIFRLPGMLNIPDANKRARGRIERPAKLLHFNGPTYGMRQIRELAPVAAPGSAASDLDPRVSQTMAEIDLAEASECSTFEALPVDLRNRFAVACDKNPQLQSIWEGDPNHVKGAKSGSTSEWHFALAYQIQRVRQLEFSVTEFAQLLHVWPQISEFWEKYDDDQLCRQIARDWVKTTPTADAAETVIKWFDPSALADQSGGLFPDEPKESWPAPIDLFGDELPTQLSEPPVGSLPPILERWARSEARRKGVPLSFAAASALATVAAAIGSSLNIQARSMDNTWALPASLWVCLVAPPGAAKSPLISSAIAPLRKLDTEYRRSDLARHAEWSERKRNKATANIGGPEPRMRRTLVDDTTIEQLIKIQADNPRGVLRVPDELSALLGSFGAYKKTGDGDRGNFLGMFDGRAISKDRVNGQSSVYAEHALLGILAGTQPKKIAACVRDLGGDGLLQRFLFVVHDGVEREGLDEAPDMEAGHRYAHIVRQLATAEYGSKTPVRLSPAAYTVLQDGWRKIKTLMHIPGASDDWIGHVNKWENFLHRIALTFHAVEMVEFLGVVDPTWEVSEDVARRAVAFSSYLVRHGLQFYETNYQGADDTVLARWIAGHFLTKPDLAAVTVRDITDIKKELRGEQNFRTLAAAMAELEHFGWVRVSKTTSRGPSQWKINPAVHARFKQRADWERKTREEKRARIQQAVKARNDFTSEDILSGLEA